MFLPQIKILLNWSSVQIHHIRPRQYGGALNDFNNLMPVKTESHRAITSWFRNY